MKFSAFFLVIAFFSVAILGFLGVSHMNGYHSRCLTETARAADCPQQSVVAFINFNFNTLKSFSTAILTLAVFFAALFIFLYAIVAVARPLSNLANFWRQEFKSSPIVSESLRGFLSLREKSPPRL